MSQARKITFHGSFSAAGVTPNGLSDVSLITGGVEALGHGVFVDEISLRQVAELCVGKSLPAYLTHDGLYRGDRLTQEIGLFSGIALEGSKVVARQFNFLDAFKKYEPKACALLLELAKKIPDQFGLSIVFSGWAAWVRKDGSEVMDYEAPMPEDAVRSMPSIRIASIESADFVKNPAANPDGLAALKALMAGEQITMSTPITFSQEQHDSLLSAAVKEALEKLSVDHLAELAAKDAALAAQADEHKQALAALAEQHTAALAAKDQERATALAEQAKLHETTLAKANEALAKAESLSAANLGIQPIKFAPATTQQSAERPMSDNEAWNHYAKLKEQDPAAAEAFRALRLKK